jgi:hypothetical protein
MDSRDRTVIFARVPRELIMLAKCYQNTSRIPTFSGTIQRLLETHPELVKLAELLYADPKGESSPQEQ